MKPKEGGLYLPRLDQLRFVAASMVVFTHAWEMFYVDHHVDRLGQMLFRLGDSGVAIFFVLSGFIFTYLAERQRGANGSADIDYRAFVYNRFVRIFPLLIFVVGIGIYASKGQRTPIDLLYPLFLMTNVGPAVQDGYPMLWTITWTIAVECQFYLLFPFLYRFTLARGPKFIIGLIVLMNLVRFSLYFTLPDYIRSISYSTLPYRIDQFLVGMLLAWITVHHRFPRGMRFVLRLSAIASIVTLFLSYTHLEFLKSTCIAQIWWPLAEGLMWAIVIGASLTTTFMIYGVIGNTVSKLGEASYSLYLTHLFVILPIANTIKPAINWATTGSDPRMLWAYLIVLGMLPCAVAASLFVHAYIERPFLEFRVRYFKIPLSNAEKLRRIA
ncbi:acyltransferase family protein [Burkholderia lata]|uniref:Putative phage transmembrane acetyltransferase n=1 Tax=Burkholderia lata (strain ATCC 17760 / DSM 23089 / LMG 22485 / NCIMB 9086 / R18194 / 383) TaxID=482957 RepID=A0A6P2GR75_BURL3|nr:acyltransferase [Burkholderia lata]VWB06889.1 putative phage transmembrane acetyltransferase [Burkholderia lata]